MGTGAPPAWGRLHHQSIFITLLAASTFMLEAASQGEWHRGRATHYSGPGDGWTIHEGRQLSDYFALLRPLPLPSS